MTLRTEPWPTGTPCWTDLMVADVDRSAAFYAALFGWQVGEPDERGYRIATLDGVPVAGFTSTMGGMAPAPAWTVYLACDDLAAVDAAARDRGARTVVAPMPLGDQGSMALWIDPQSCAVAAWQAGTRIGQVAYDVPGTPMWMELRSDDRAASERFYTEVFGLSVQPGGPGYSMFTPAGADRPAGGIGAAEGLDPGWHLSFLVADLDAACAAVQAHGGRIDSPPVAFEYGRSAALSGPDGECFGLVSR